MDLEPQILQETKKKPPANTCLSTDIRIPHKGEI